MIQGLELILRGFEDYQTNRLRFITNKSFTTNEAKDSDFTIAATPITFTEAKKIIKNILDCNGLRSSRAQEKQKIIAFNVRLKATLDQLKSKLESR